MTIRKGGAGHVAEAHEGAHPSTIPGGHWRWPAPSMELLCRPPGYRSPAWAKPGVQCLAGSIWMLAVCPWTRRTPSGTWSITIRTGTRWARRTQVKIGFTCAKPA